ncbi:MAG: NAD-dependent epimerase/dehydratase family protein [Anaerolineaceae bacterium]
MNEKNIQVVFGKGPVGRSVIAELLRLGRSVRLVTRGGMIEGLPTGIEVVAGDAADPASARRVCAGASVVYSCVNARDYQKWPLQFPPLQAGILEGAASSGARLVVLENLYMYGPHDGRPMTEDTPLNGKGSRSTTRKQMTLDLWEAHRAGRVQVTSGRASDFFGPRCLSTLGEPVFKAALVGKPAKLLGDPDQPHTYTYIKDIGKALVILGERDEALGQAWHIPSPRTVTTREFVGMVYAAAGKPARLQAMPTWLISLVSPFIPPIRGISENFYQLNEPYILDHSRFAQAFGDISTPLDQAIRETLDFYCN